MTTPLPDISPELLSTAIDMERTFCAAGVAAGVSPNHQGRFDVGILGGASIDRFAELVRGIPSAMAVARALGLWEVEEDWWTSVDLDFPPESDWARLRAWISIPENDALELAFNLSHPTPLTDAQKATMAAERELRRHDVSAASSGPVDRLLVRCDTEDVPISVVGSDEDGSINELCIWGAEAAEKVVRMLLAVEPLADQRIELRLLPSMAWGHGVFGSGDQCDSGHPFRYCVQIWSDDLAILAAT